jgi:hypothetical protein
VNNGGSEVEGLERIGAGVGLYKYRQFSKMNFVITCPKIETKMSMTGSRGHGTSIASLRW